MKKYKLIKNYPGCSWSLGNGPTNTDFIWDNNKPKKLFTTEDGVDIFKGDKYYWLNYINQIFVNSYAYNSCGKLNRKYFSTEKAAEEYILMNKPCLSINDLSDFYYTGKKVLTLQKLKNLVKSKL